MCPQFVPKEDKNDAIRNIMKINVTDHQNTLKIDNVNNLWVVKLTLRIDFGNKVQ